MTSSESPRSSLMSKDGYHIWRPHTYDRRLQERVRRFRTTIASAIVGALQLKLTPQETQRLS